MFNTLYLIQYFRSVSYTVNNFHKHHVTVLAEVVPVSLELSISELILKPSFGLPSEAGLYKYKIKISLNSLSVPYILLGSGGFRAVRDSIKKENFVTSEQMEEKL